MLRDQIDIASARRDHHRLTKVQAEQHRGDAGRVEVMRVYNIEFIAALEHLSKRSGACTSHQERSRAHADLRQQRIAWMQHLDAVQRLLPRRFARAPGIARDPGATRETTGRGQQRQTAPCRSPGGDGVAIRRRCRGPAAPSSGRGSRTSAISSPNRPSGSIRAQDAVIDIHVGPDHGAQAEPGLGGGPPAAPCCCRLAASSA